MKIPRDPPNVSRILSKRKELIAYLDRADVKDYINEMNHRYLYWDEITYRQKPPKTTHENIWALMKLMRSGDIERFKLSEEEIFQFQYKVIPRFLSKLHEFDLNMGGSIASGSIIPDGDKDLYLISSLMEEAIASSQLEGAATTTKVAKDMLRKERRPHNKSELMILNNYITIKKILKMKKKITPEMILDIHASITKGTLDNEEDEGRFRTTNDILVMNHATGEVYYTPPDYEHIEPIIKALCDFINENSKKKFIHPIIKASIIHFLLGYIHPFVDGNGRTARALFYWYLLSRGYWLIEYTSISRTILKAPSKYARAYLYTEKDDNDITYFISFQLRTLDLALKDLKTYIRKKIKEKDWIYELVQVDGLNGRQVEIIKRIANNPKMVLSINEIKNTFDVVYQTARMDLLGLVELGYLKKSRAGKKKLIFTRGPKFDTLLNEQKNL